MIYRVIERTTNLYRNVTYLSSKPYDYNNGFGETASETVIEEFESYSKDVKSESSFNPCVESEIDEKAVKKTIAETKEFSCSETVAISYVRLSKKDNDLNVEIKVGDKWISVIRDEYEKDFIHIVTVADLSEVNNKFRM